MKSHRDSENTFSAELPLDWDREWHRDRVKTSTIDFEAHYDRGGIVLMTAFVDSDMPLNTGLCYPDGLIEYLEDIQQAGAEFDAKAYLQGITRDIARDGLERGRALLRLMAYTLSQPPSLTENIWKHVGVKKQMFLVDKNGRGELPDEVLELVLQIITAEESEDASVTGGELAEAEQRDKRAPLFVEDAGGLRLVDKWWIDRGLAWQNGTLKSAVMNFLPETLEEFEIMNAERAKGGLPPTSKEEMRAYCYWVAQKLGLLPQTH